MPNNWAEWDAAHGHGEGRTRSADKLAEAIKASLGHTGSPAVPVHGSRGSVVHRTTKKDLKRPAPVKGEKDQADSMRTRIRMAAYQRKKTGATLQDPVDKHTPKVEQRANPHESSASKIAGQIKTEPTDERSKSYETARHEAYRATQAADSGQTDPAKDRAAAEAHARAADLAPNEQKQRAHDTQARLHRAQAKQVESARAAAVTTEPTDERKANHYKLMAGRAQLASESAKTASEHRTAAKAHSRAAELAPTTGQRIAHQNLSANHTASAAVEDRAEAAAAAKRDAAEKAARDRATASAKETEAAKQRVAQRQADNLANLSDRAEGASARAERENTHENHQAASDAHQKAADVARQMGQTDMARHHQNLAGMHQMAAEGPRKRMGKGGNRSMDTGKTPPPLATKSDPNQSAHEKLYQQYRTKATQLSAAASTPQEHEAAANAQRAAAQLSVTKAQKTVHEAQAAKHDKAAKGTVLAIGAEKTAANPREFKAKGPAGLRTSSAQKLAEQARGGGSEHLTENGALLHPEKFHGQGVSRDDDGDWVVNHGGYGAHQGGIPQLTSKTGQNTLMPGMATWSMSAANGRYMGNRKAADAIWANRDAVSKVVKESGLKGHVRLDVHGDGDVYNYDTGHRIGHIPTPGEERRASGR